MYRKHVTQCTLAQGCSANFQFFAIIWAMVIFFVNKPTLLSTKLFLYFRGKTNPHFSYLQPLEFLLNRRAVATNGRFAPRHQRSLRGAGREGAARRLQLPHLAQLGRHHGAVTTAPWQQAGAGTKKHQTKCHVYRFIQGLI